jgi:hypothetical protein
VRQQERLVRGAAERNQKATTEPSDSFAILMSERGDDERVQSKRAVSRPDVLRAGPWDLSINKGGPLIPFYVTESQGERRLNRVMAEELQEAESKRGNN